VTSPTHVSNPISNGFSDAPAVLRPVRSPFAASSYQAGTGGSSAGRTYASKQVPRQMRVSPVPGTIGLHHLWVAAHSARPSNESNLSAAQLKTSRDGPCGMTSGHGAARIGSDVK
jgi:hypothetical protein